MLLLLLPDGYALLDLAGQRLILVLRVLLAVFHQLDGKGEAQHARKQREPEDFALLRLHFLAGVLLPDFVVRLFLAGEAQQHLLVFLALGEGGNLLVDHTFRQLALLHPADDVQGSL